MKGENEMLSKFRTYQLALGLYRQAQGRKVSPVARDHLQRACLSVCLNLAEGWGKPTMPERRRFFGIALGSLREVQALIDIESVRLGDLNPLADKVGAHIYRLITA
jgi:four helix bundle protein